MKKLVYQIKQLCYQNCDGSFATRAKRKHILMLSARQLSGELGYLHMEIRSLKPKHIDALVKLWRSQNLAVSTIKCRMVQLRWWATKINKQNVIARDNAHYGIEHRQDVSKTSKAINVEYAQINAIQDEYVKASVLLMKTFGLRKEEAIKIMPRMADLGDHLWLKASWCKGGRERRVPIRTNEQREALENAKRIAGAGSLIRSANSFYQQRKRYEYLIACAKLTKLHGLRHQYAQTRYRELTGWNCPHKDGTSRRELDNAKKEIDNEARLRISNELGHNRIQIVANYIGS